MNNRKVALRVQLILTVVVTVFSSLWVCSLVFESMQVTELQYASGILALLSTLYFIYGGFYYFDISLEDKVISVKYYNSFPFSRVFKMYRIPQHSYVKSEIKGSSFYRRKLFIYQISANQISKYPPLYVTACDKRCTSELLAFFEKVGGNKNIKSSQFE